uniref:Protein lifeguard 1 n=1 Tax=Trichuris muris TaxID=70415 RepID=A0A5S6QYR1_TRIMR
MASQPPYNPYYVPGQPQQGNIGWQQPPPPGAQYGYGQGGYPGYPPPPRVNMDNAYVGGYGASRPAGDDPENPKYGYGFDEKSIRQGFIRKVFLILSGQLLIVSAMVALFTYHTGTKLFVRHNLWLHWMALAVFMATYIAIGCCTNVRRRYPGNVICLGFLTLSLGYIAATTASFYNTESVAIAAIICFLACLGVSLFSMQTKYDFTGCMGVMCVVGLVLFLFGIMCAIFTVFMKTPILMIVYAGFGALVFLIYLAIDIQLVIGGKRLEISPEDYVFAAAQLLVDIVYIFIYLLQIVGFARD